MNIAFMPRFARLDAGVLHHIMTRVIESRKIFRDKKNEVRKWIIFGTDFFLIFSLISGPFWEPIWGQIGLRGAKMSPRRASRASKYRILHLQKVRFPCAKTILVESWRLLRRSQEAQEGSQEALEELQDLKRKGSKNGTKKNNMFIIFGAVLGSQIGPKIA